MKSKFDKILNIILISLLVALGISIAVLYAINPTMVKEWFEYVVELVNKPLPIVGVTTLAVLVFVWKLVISTNYGKAKLSLYDRKQKELEQEHENFVSDAQSELQIVKDENALLKGFIIHICELSTNQKIKNYGKELLEYGKAKETIDGETKAD